MKRLVFIIVILSACVFAAKADPAKKVNLSYQNGILKIEAIHKVKDVTKHYIELVTIKVDGKEVKKIQLKAQSSPEAAVIDVPLPDLAKGTQIEVSTRCNEFGDKSSKLTL